MKGMAAVGERHNLVASLKFVRTDGALVVALELALARNLCRLFINRHRGRLTLIIIIIITITTIITTTTVASFAVAPVIAAHPFTLC